MIASLRLTLLPPQSVRSGYRIQETGYTVRNSTFAKRKALIIALCLATDLPYETRDSDKQKLVQSRPKSSQTISSQRAYRQFTRAAESYTQDKILRQQEGGESYGIKQGTLHSFKIFYFSTAN